MASTGVEVSERELLLVKRGRRPTWPVATADMILPSLLRKALNIKLWQESFRVDNWTAKDEDHRMLEYHPGMQ